MAKPLSERLEDVMALVPEAAAWADEHKVKVKVPEDVEPSDQWPARSGLQKAIRRGEMDEALVCLARLWKTAPDYLWTALATIAVEDVGFGSPEAVLWSHVAKLKTFRQKLDEGRLATALVAQMCEAPKTRSCCELSIAVDWAYQKRIEEMSLHSTDALVETLFKPDVGESYIAARLLRGHVPEGMSVVKKLNGREQFAEAVNDRYDEPWALAIVHAFERPVDSMSLAMLPTTKMFFDVLQHDTVEIVEDVFPVSMRVGKFASEAWDMHTQIGKMALKAFWTSLVKSYPVIAEIPKTKAGKALGAAVFVEEGGLVDRRIMGGDFHELQVAQDTTFLPVYGVPPDHYAEIRKIVRTEIDRLNQKRVWALKLGESW